LKKKFTVKRQNSLKMACFEEKIHREVEKVEERRGKRGLRAKTYSASSTL
jgi:hypothetical protein